MHTIRKALDGLPLGGMRIFNTVDSTNSEAARWLEGGAPDLALVVADEQTAGRGRGNRRWFTPGGAALAFSVVLKGVLGQADEANLTHLTALGALALCEALEAGYQLPAEIKWPNDVLVDGRKLAGVLVEAHWLGERLAGVILGIGINIAPEAVPPAEALLFPATCVNACLATRRPGYEIAERGQLLRQTLEALLHWRNEVGSTRFLAAWEERLAYREAWVEIWQDLASAESPHAFARYSGRLEGLNADGSLRLREHQGSIRNVSMGELRLRPAEAPAKRR